VIVSAIIAAKSLVESGEVLRGEFSIHAVADEEYLTK
jgi:hypothetical protein